MDMEMVGQSLKRRSLTDMAMDTEIPNQIRRSLMDTDTDTAIAKQKKTIMATVMEQKTTPSNVFYKIQR